MRSTILTLALGGLILAGCNRGGATPGSAVNDEGGSPASVIAGMVKAYRNAKTYDDSGVLIFRGIADGERQEDQPLPLSLAYSRPDKVRLHRFGVVLACDGEVRRAAILPVGGVAGIPDQVLETPAPLELKPANVCGDVMLEEAFSWDMSEIDPVRLGLLLTDDPLEAEADFAKDAKFLEEAVLEDRPCYCIEVPRGENASRTYWIDKETSVLRRLEIASPALKQKLDSEGEFSKLVARLELTGAQLDKPIDPAAFEFETPHTAVRVKRFVAPVNPPPQQLGAKVDAFEFEDLAGEKVAGSAWEGDIVVLDFWFTTCPPCRDSMPILEKLHQRYKDNERVKFFAVSIDPENVANDHLQSTLAEWGATAPILRDPEAHHQAIFQAPGAPSMYLLGPDGRIQAFKAGLSRNHSDFEHAIDRLLAGADVAKEALKTYDELQSKFEQELSEVAIEPESQLVEIVKTEIAPRSEPENIQLEEAWRATDLKQPGNLLTVKAKDGSVRIFALDGWNAVVELDQQGRVLARRDLELPENSGVSFFRTAVDAAGDRYFLATASRQPQVHLFDSEWKRLRSYPEGEDVHVGDGQLGDTDGDGKLEMIVGYWGVVGVQDVSLEGERRWANRTLENVVQLEVGPPDESGKRNVYCVSTRGTITPINSRGEQEADQVIANRAVVSLAIRDLDGDGESECCALVAAPGAGGAVEAVGLDADGEELWRYELPPGYLESPVDRIVAAQLAPGDGGWLLPAADGSIHLLNKNGQLVDRFNYGAKLTGLALAPIDGSPVLLVSTPANLTAWKLTPKSE
jgi:thiol-disulfide isomerase/thioredoxin